VDHFIVHRDADDGWEGRRIALAVAKEERVRSAIVHGAASDLGDASGGDARGARGDGEVEDFAHGPGGGGELVEFTSGLEARLRRARHRSAASEWEQAQDGHDREGIEASSHRAVE
jgi:hypothetical protein